MAYIDRPQKTDKKWGPRIAGTIICIFSVLIVLGLLLGRRPDEASDIAALRMMFGLAMAGVGFVASHGLFKKRLWAYRAAAMFYVMVTIQAFATLSFQGSIGLVIMMALVAAYFLYANSQLTTDVQEPPPPEGSEN